MEGVVIVIKILNFILNIRYRLLLKLSAKHLILIITAVPLTYRKIVVLPLWGFTPLGTVHLISVLNGRRVMKFTVTHMFIIGLVALLLGGAGIAGFMYRVGFRNPEGFAFTRVGGGEGFTGARSCDICRKPPPCGCGGGSGSGSRGSNKPAPIAPCPRTLEPDLSKYILKSQIPSMNGRMLPDMSNYMLKTECPPVPDLSKYVLKSSIPKPQPVIIDNSSCKKDAGECPPCPRPRCPEVKCHPPVKCAPPAPCPRPVCPPTVVKCKSEEAAEPIVRPFLAPLNMSNFGTA